jgi:hypothetical protein
MCIIAKYTMGIMNYNSVAKNKLSRKNIGETFAPTLAPPRSMPVPLPPVLRLVSTCITPF